MSATRRGSRRWAACRRSTGRFARDFGQQKDLDAVVFVLPFRFQSRCERFVRRRLAESNSVRLNAARGQEFHDGRTAFVAEPPMIAKGAAFGERPARGM